MNEEALILAYNQAKATGYNGTQGQFQSLLTEDDSALDLAYSQARSTGFTGELDAFGDLLGLKKRIQIQPLRTKIHRRYQIV